MRGVAAAISALPEVNTDWAGLIDSWALRFLHEMDYVREAANAALFRWESCRGMASRCPHTVCVCVCHSARLPRHGIHMCVLLRTALCRLQAADGGRGRERRGDGRRGR
jgi:hypothetical protein